MKNARAIIRKPLLTEKGARQKAAENKYSFVVDRNANKLEIKTAVEEIFGVHVERVWTTVFRGKQVRLGVHVGPRPAWKRATVKLRAGDRIEIFEEV
jgi:large subunit ribosomal protein L23